VYFVGQNARKAKPTANPDTCVCCVRARVCVCMYIGVLCGAERAEGEAYCKPCG
jgi:hypothetical protein